MAPQRVFALCLQELPDWPVDLVAELRLKLAPPINVAADGSHWYRTWLMLRDSLVYFPWYSGKREHLRRCAADFSAQSLHDWTCDVLQQPKSYAQLIGAVLREGVLPQLRSAVTLAGNSNALMVEDIAADAPAQLTANRIASLCKAVSR